MLLDVSAATPLKAVPVATPLRAVVKGIDVKTVMKTVLKANALQQDKHRRQSSNAHPRMVQQERQSSPEPPSQSDDDEQVMSEVCTGSESDDSVIQPGGVKGFFAFEADASDGGGRSSGSEGSAAYDVVINKNAVGEKEILLSPSHPLHEIGSAEIKKKSEWAGKVLGALQKLHAAHSRPKGSLSKNQLASIAKLWSKFPGAPILSANKQRLALKEYN